MRKSELARYAGIGYRIGDNSMYIWVSMYGVGYTENKAIFCASVIANNYNSELLST